MEERLKKLMECLPEGMDGALLLAPVHRRYYLDIVSSAGTLLVTRSKCIFIVDFRYIVMARGHIRGAEVLLQDNLEEQLKQLIVDENLKCIGTDGPPYHLTEFSGVSEDDGRPSHLRYPAGRGDRQTAESEICRRNQQIGESQGYSGTDV